MKPLVPHLQLERDGLVQALLLLLQLEQARLGVQEVRRRRERPSDAPPHRLALTKLCEGALDLQ